MSDSDESLQFEELLAELERAAGELGDSDPGSAPLDPADFTSSDLDVPATSLDPLFEGDEDDEWGRPPTRLTQEPKSLVDLRVLSIELPFGHETGVLEEEDTIVDRIAIEPGVIVDHKYEIIGAAPRTTAGWEAQHVVLRQKFIVQQLDPEIVDDPILWPKFQADIRTAGMLGHENIEFVTDFGRCPRHGAYLVKQWIEGPTLAEFVTEHGAQGAGTAVDFAHSIGEALAALHEIGIIHGRLSGESIVRTGSPQGPIWKLLDVCIPGEDELLLAPEQQRGEATGPEADQYALAHLTRTLMVGPDGDEGEIPDDVEDVLQTALADMPFGRWPDIDTFLSKLMAVAPVKHEPTVHPFDRREASRLVEQGVQQASAEPSESAGGFAERPRSMRIDVDLDAMRSRVRVDFNTGARLRREYRRNMLAGGLFVPTALELSVGDIVDVELRYPARDASVTIEASVVTFDPGGEDRPRGYGVAFGPSSRGELERFVGGLNLGLGISPDHQIEMVKKLDRDAALDPGAAFLASRLGAKTKVGAARAMFAGLPYDFDECLSALIDADYVEIVAPDGGVETPIRRRPEPVEAARPAPAKAAKPSRPAEPERRPEREKASPPRSHSFEEHEWADVDRVLETVAFFEEQGNFMAAGRLLESAASNAPEVGAYHHRLALLRARFDMDLAAARRSIGRAMELEPRNKEYAASNRYIATLVEMSAVRTVWERDLGGELRWVRTEPGLNTIWFERRTDVVELIEVDWRRDSSDVQRRDAGWAVVAENDSDFDALERRKEVNLRSARARRARQVEIASRFGGLGPHFEKRPVAQARTANSTLAARTGSGVSVRRRGGEPLELSQGDAREPKFAPDEQVLAWLEKTRSGWELHVSPVTGPPTTRGTFENRPLFQWLDDSSGLLVVEPRTGEVWIVDRRSGQRELKTLSGFMKLALIPTMAPDEAMIVGHRVVGRQSWVAIRLDVRSGEIVDQYELPAGGADGILRADGKFALKMYDGGLLVADLPGSTVKLLSTVSATPGSVAGANWPEESPLVVAEIVEGTVRVLSIDVDLLCG